MLVTMFIIDGYMKQCKAAEKQGKYYEVIIIYIKIFSKNDQMNFLFFPWRNIRR